MIKRISFSIAVALFLGSLTAFADEPQVEVFELRTPTGILQERFEYYLKDGQKVEHGLSSVHYDNGQVLTLSEYQHGQHHGAVKSYFEWINKLSYEAEFVAGHQHGTTRYWSPQGKLLFESEWKNGKPISGIVCKGTLSAGLGETIRTIQYKDGIAIAGSEKSFHISYQRPLETNGLPDFSQFLRWSHCMYDYGSTYEYLNELPPHEKIPEVLALFQNAEKDHNVIDSQLETLTRIRPEFGATKNQAHAIWSTWWNQVGQQQLEKLRSTKPDKESWKLACNGRELPLPEQPVILPDEYELVLDFRSGDYAGVCKEKITLTRSKTAATLKRVFSTKTGAPSVTEHWHGFTCEAADRVTRAIGHVVDHPWLQNDEVEIHNQFLEELREQKRQQANGAKQGVEYPKKYSELPGRESFSLYYAYAKYELRDLEGNLWWNADPKHWRGLNEDRYNWFGGHSGLRSVGPIYTFFVSQFPAIRSNGKSQGWE